MRPGCGQARKIGILRQGHRTQRLVRLEMGRRPGRAIDLDGFKVTDGNAVFVALGPGPIEALR
jgi:hypothetical protein